uniref:Uncharacterized protein n=1 Tax=Ananas comosus var. bracteatus TaxID=296719 RepID=A0A6V7P4P2_ANACO|nr:unnamed protein product [Ananas comosus var. bracteatus]
MLHPETANEAHSGTCNRSTKRLAFGSFTKRASRSRAHFEPNTSWLANSELDCHPYCDLETIDAVHGLERRWKRKHRVESTSQRDSENRRRQDLHEGKKRRKKKWGEVKREEGDEHGGGSIGSDSGGDHHDGGGHNYGHDGEARDFRKKGWGMAGGPTAVLRAETRISHRESKPSPNSTPHPNSHSHKLIKRITASFDRKVIERLHKHFLSRGASVDFGSKALELLELRDGAKIHNQADPLFASPDIQGSFSLKDIPMNRPSKINW